MIGLLAFLIVVVALVVVLASARSQIEPAYRPSPEVAALNRTLAKWNGLHRHLGWIDDQLRTIDRLQLPVESRDRIKSYPLRERERVVEEMRQMDADLTG
jgi:regulator of protease activity HflC (stomatin/prohibitin superfamily)